MPKAGKMRGAMAALVVVFIWSGWIIISKWGISNALTLWDVTLIRFISAATLVLLYALYSQYPLRSLFRWPIIVCSLCCGTLYLCAAFIGLLLSDAANTGVIINGTLPIMCALIVFVWKKQRLHPSQYLAVLLILIANVLLFSSAGGASWSALLWLLLSAFFMAFYSVSMRIWAIDLRTIVVAVPLLNALFFTPLWFFLPSNLIHASAHEIVLQGAYQGVVVSIVALFLMSYSINKLGAVSASAILALVPIVSTLLAMLFLEQQLSVQAGFSILLCSVGIACYSVLHPLTSKWKNRRG